MKKLKVLEKMQIADNANDRVSISVNMVSIFDILYKKSSSGSMVLYWLCRDEHDKLFTLATYYLIDEADRYYIDNLSFFNKSISERINTHLIRASLDVYITDMDLSFSDNSSSKLLATKIDKDLGNKIDIILPSYLSIYMKFIDDYILNKRTDDIRLNILDSYRENNISKYKYTELKYIFTDDTKVIPTGKKSALFIVNVIPDDMHTCVLYLNMELDINLGRKGKAGISKYISAMNEFKSLNTPCYLCNYHIDDFITKNENDKYSLLEAYNANGDKKYFLIDPKTLDEIVEKVYLL